MSNSSKFGLDAANSVGDAQEWSVRKGKNAGSRFQTSSLTALGGDLLYLNMEPICRVKREQHKHMSMPLNLRGDIDPKREETGGGIKREREQQREGEGFA